MLYLEMIFFVIFTSYNYPYTCKFCSFTEGFVNTLHLFQICVPLLFP